MSVFRSNSTQNGVAVENNVATITERGRLKAFTSVAKLPNVLNRFCEHGFKEMVKCGVATIFLTYFNLNACFQFSFILIATYIT